MEKQLNIVTADGTCHAQLYTPEGEGSWPGVIHLTDIGGIRASHIEMAKRLAAEGYAVLLPNVFFRNGEPPVIDFPIKPDNAAQMKRMQELRDALPPETMAKDVRHYAEFLQAQKEVGAGRIGVVGYCITGSMAILGAAAAPDEIGAAASFHGTGLYKEDGTGAHSYLNRVKAQLHIGYATDDSHMPPELTKKFDEALAAWGGTYESKTYTGKHGWCVLDAPAFNKEEADKAFAALLKLFKDSLWR